MDRPSFRLGCLGGNEHPEAVALIDYCIGYNFEKD
jgi:hypothetical protein